ncbi:hypothetical protein [Dinoroseobacter sp. S124A]|uniref:hypothetical protein n=1 Tax=Dinoroseobacter sp. S124A TaxID=3415128 RepID=UPI003C7A52B6
MRNSLYFPLLGGDRIRDVEILATGLSSANGSLNIVGDLVRFEAGPALTNAAFGVPVSIVVPIRATIDGKLGEFKIPLLAENTPDGVEITLPGGRVVTDTAYISPVSVADQLDDPLSFSSPDITPVSVDESILVDRFNEENPEFLAAVTAAQSDVDAAQQSFAAAQEALEDAEALVALVYETAPARAAADAANEAALLLEAAARGAVAAVNAASELVQGTAAAIAAAQDLVNSTQAAAASASSAVTAASNAVAVAANAAEDFLNDAFKILRDGGFDATRSVLEFALDIPGIGALLQPVYDDLVDAEDDLADARVDLSGAQAALTSALNAVSDALDDLSQAEIDFSDAEEALSNAQFELPFALEAASEARQVADAAEAAARALEAEVSQNGLTVPVDLLSFEVLALEIGVTAAAGAVGLAATELGAAEAALLAATTAYEAQLAFLPDVEFEFELSDISLDLDVQAGLEFNWNRANDDAPRESLLSLVYEVELALAVDASSEVNGEVNVIDIDRGVELSGRVPFEGGGRDRAERFEPGERWAEFADGFDFL